MTGKRKRKRATQANEGDQKRQKIIGGNNKDPLIKHALLLQYYPKVSSLREYLLSSLPSTSKIRRRKISSVGCKAEDKKSDRELSQFLDHTLIGVCQKGEFSRDEKKKQLTSFSQKPDESTSFANVSTAGVYSQSEVCDCIALRKLN
jgi:telomerase reverse transcriptase